MRFSCPGAQAIEKLRPRKEMSALAKPLILGSERGAHFGNCRAEGETRLIGELLQLFFACQGLVERFGEFGAVGGQRCNLRPQR